MSKKNTIAVIGAGMAGLACAYELQKAGHQVLVYEKQDSIGGRLLSRYSGSLPFDIGAQMVSMSYDQALRYSQELGIENSWVPMPGTTHHLYHRGKLHLASYNSLKEFLCYSYLPPIPRIKLLLFITWMRMRARHVDFFDLSSGAEFDDQNAYDYALRWAGSEIADRVVDALVGGYHFHNSREMSLTAFMGCLNHFTRFFTFHRTTPDLNILPKALASKLKVKTNELVTRIDAVNNEVIVTSNDSPMRFDVAVIATSGNLARQLYKNPSEAQRQFLQSVRYSMTINVSFMVPLDAVKDLSLVVIPDPDSNAICSYFCQSIKYRTEEKSPRTIVNVFLREPFAEKIFSRNNDDVFKIVRDELIKTCPPLRSIAHNVEPYDIARWNAAMPKFTPGYIRQVVQFIDHGQGDQNVYLCGDYMNAPWVEGAIRSGQRVSQHIQRG